MKVLLTGAGGHQLDSRRGRSDQSLAQLTASRQQLDLADPEACSSAV